MSGALLKIGRKLPWRSEAMERVLRRHERWPCLHLAQMVLEEKRIEIDGCITEISCRGTRFRPASLYLHERTGERVCIIVDGLKMMGTIRNVTPLGYGIALSAEVEPHLLDLLRAEGKDIAAAFNVER